MRYAYAVTTYSGAMLVETIHSIPKGSRLLVVDNSQHERSLSWCWNYAIERLCRQEGFDVAICMNDDVVLRRDTGENLAHGLLEWQHSKDKQWTERELILLTARHAAPSDARTNEVDWGLLDAALPKFEPGPDFACFATTWKLIERVGYFAEELPLYHEDNDMHRRIQLAGYEAGAYAPYWHYLNGTIRTNPEVGVEARAKFETSKQRYIERWGGYVGHETFVTPYGV